MIRTPCRTIRGDRAPDSGSKGFTLIEVITVVVILGILFGATLAVRGRLMGGELAARMSEVRAQLRYVQLTAMKTGTSLALKSDGTNYFARYTANSTQIALPGERNTSISLAGKGMTLPVFFYSFDAAGIPYSGESPPVKLTSNATFTVTAGGSSGTLMIIPETGFVP